jgi:hypothetical protein
MEEKKMKKSLLLGLILLLCGLLIPTVSAIISDPYCCNYYEEPNYFPPTSDPKITDWDRNCYIDKFDSSLGTLNGATLTVETCGNQTLSLLSRDSTTRIFNVANSAWTDTTLPDGEEFQLVLVDESRPVELNSGQTYNDEVPFTCTGEETRNYATPGELAYYIGAPGEEVAIRTTATGTGAATGGGAFTLSIDTFIGTDICVVYDYTPLGCLEVCKVVDWSGAEPDPEMEFEVCLYDESAAQVGDCQWLSDDECYTWNDLVPGDYTVDETDPGDEWEVTLPCGPITVEPGQEQCSSAEVTNTYLLGCLEVCKVVDWSGAEPDPEMEFEICVYDGSAQQVDCQMLSDDECYTWYNLVPGDYTIGETDPGDAWEVTLPSGPITVEPGQEQCSYAEVTNTFVSGCTYTPGYWMTHSILGKAPYDDTWVGIENQPFYHSGKTWVQVINTVGKGNAYYILSFQYIAAYLNTLQDEPAYMPQNVIDAMDAAHALFSNPANTPAYIGTLKGNNALRQQFINLADTLDQYNNGYIGPGHCD